MPQSHDAAGPSLGARIRAAAHAFTHAPLWSKRRFVRSHLWLQVLLVTIVARIALGLIVGEPPLHADTSRDLLIARDCLERGACATEGARTSFYRLVQGDLWIRFLEAVVNVSRARSILLTLHAFSAGLLFVVPRRFCEWPVAASATSLYVIASAFAVEYPTLWNPCLLPLPAVIFTALLMSTAAEGALVPTVASGAVLAMCVDLHVSSLILVPASLAVIAATAKRAALALAGFACAFVAIEALLSPGAAIENASLLARPLPWIVVILAVSIAMGFAMRGFVRRRTEIERARALVIVMTALAAVAAVVAPVASEHAGAPRYLAPELPWIAIATAALISTIAALPSWRSWPERAWRGTSVSIALAVSGAVAFASSRENRPDPTRWRLTDAAPIGAFLLAHGYDYPEMVRHVRGPGSDELADAIATVLPRSTERDPHAQPSADVLLIRAARSEIRTGRAHAWQTVALGDGDVAIVRMMASIVAVDGVTACMDATAGQSAPDCARFDLDAREPIDAPDAPFVARSYRGSSAVTSLSRGHDSAPRTTHVTARIRTWPGVPERGIDLSSAGAGWMVEDVQGVAHHTTLPARCVRILPGSRDGSITFRFDPHRGAALRRIVPDMIETDADESALRSLLSRRTGASCTIPE